MRGALFFQLAVIKKVFPSLGPGEWRVFPRLKEKRRGFALINWNDQLFAIGGEAEDGKAKDSIEHFDPEKQQWNVLDVKLPRGRLEFAAVVFP